VPQIIYYFTAYAGLLQREEITPGEEINITVPTGNFGNILAGYYAYKMGLPVNKFICASNDNKVLTDFLKTGIYDKNRDFKETISPSMDILISSNLERFLFEMTGHDGAEIDELYRQLEEKGRFEINQQTLGKISEIFTGEYATEEETKYIIEEIYHKYNYVIDPHTAVGVKAYQNYLNNSNDKTITIIDSTANPYKFASTVLEAINSEVISSNIDEFDILHKLEEEIESDIHPGLEGLSELKVNHEQECKVSEIRDIIQMILR
jgi:threonine synthase